MSAGDSDKESGPGDLREGALTYGAYLKVEELLDLQAPRSSPAEHDEMLFIIIHQVYELWFKLVLHECAKVRDDLDDDRLFDALATLKRVRMVLKTLVAQIDVLETMTPLEFSSFRARLDMASGFQSGQFRELEFLLGHKRPAMLRFHPEGTTSHRRMKQRLEEPSLIEALYGFLERRGMRVPEDLKDGMPSKDPADHEALQSQLIDAYRTQHDLVLLLEAMMDIDEGLQEWRYRHVKMVERTIGTKMGTGGSAGAEYLRTTLFQPLFPDLWAIRSRF